MPVIHNQTNSVKKRSDYNFINSKLVKWHVINGRVFRWRMQDASNYEKIIAEVFLQRTRAETVSNMFEEFIEKYSSWKDIINADENELVEFLKPLGLWKRRLVSLKKLAKEIIKYGDDLPKDREKLEALPGVGQYIANAILLVCHGLPEPLLDTNMARVLERFYGPRKLADIRYDPYLQELSRRVVNCEDPKIINWAILDLAASTCKIKNPICESCPLSEKCSFANGGLPEKDAK